MKVAFDGIGRESATFMVLSGKVGNVCKMAQNGVVKACSAGDDFIGVMEAYRGGYGSIMLRGFAEVAYTGTAPAVGYVKLVADGNGGVKIGEGMKVRLVAAVDEDRKTAVIEL